jgi:hypothetical protein
MPILHPTNPAHPFPASTHPLALVAVVVDATPTHKCMSMPETHTISDRSPGHLRAPINNLLHLNLTPSKRFHALINAAGGIATASIYNLDFDNGGLRHLTAGVSFTIYQAFDTWEQAFAHICHFYPHIKLKANITDMNTNCCHDTSTSTTPAPPSVTMLDHTQVHLTTIRNASTSTTSPSLSKPHV